MNTIPSRKPIKMQINRDINPFLIPLFLNSLSPIRHPKVLAKTGPMIGETSIEATMTTELSSSSPKRAMKQAKKR